MTRYAGMEECEITNKRCTKIIAVNVFNLPKLPKKPHPNAILERAYQGNKCPPDKAIQSLSKQSDVSVRRIERWFRIRRNQDRTPVMKKFCESSWRCAYYTLIFTYGLQMVWQNLTGDMYWYYAMQSAFYLSLIMSLCADHRRKDFMEMSVHHVMTLLLMFLSWTINAVRFGCLVLVLHDCVDPMIEMAKMTVYLKKKKFTNVVFVLFLVTWVATRMIYFPCWLVYNAMFDSIPHTGMASIYYFLNGLLVGLQILHVIWFYFILMFARQALTSTEVRQDSRSSDEGVSEDSSSSSSRETADTVGALSSLPQNGSLCST